jgi:serine/threonine-protein kinase
VNAQFMPPEQVRGEELESRADLYAAGAVLYQILTGKRPFGASAQLPGKHASQSELHPGALPPPSAVARGLGDSFDSLLASALSVDKADRPGSAFVLLKDFDAACRRGVRIAP